MDKELRYLVYNTPDEDVSVRAIVRDDTIWLTQKAMAELFDCSSDNVSLHLKNIYADGELIESATTEDFSVVQKEGSREVKRTSKFYNLDAIISVGYRVNSRKATNFRIWATGILKEYMSNAFTMDEFATSINEFLAFRKYDILKDKGCISKKEADKKAISEYDEFNKTQKIISDFEKQAKRIQRKGGANE